MLHPEAVAADERCITHMRSLKSGLLLRYDRSRRPRMRDLLPGTFECTEPKLAVPSVTYTRTHDKARYVLYFEDAGVEAATAERLRESGREDNADALLLRNGNSYLGVLEGRHVTKPLPGQAAE